MSKSAAMTSAVAVIWTGVLLISLFSPDLVSGSQPEHLPLPAITSWVWGIAGTGYVLLLAVCRRTTEAEPTSRSFVGAIVAVWATAAIASISGPELVTGSGPTEVPLTALMAPPAAAMATAVVCLIEAITSERTPQSQPRPAGTGLPANQ